MALKKKKIPKTMQEEQLYKLEILVCDLDLYPEKVANADVCDLIVRISFIDLTPLDIIVEEFIKENNSSKNKENRFSDKRNTYESCKSSCLFTRTSSNLIQSIKSTPLSIEVYRIPHGKDRNSQDEILLCAATAFLSSICEQVTTSKDKINGLQIPCVLEKIYTLIDNEGTNCGSIAISLKLSYFEGSSEYIAFQNRSFDKCNNSKLSKIPDPVYSLLTKPQASPHVSMNEPGFDQLTNAEKLNDRKYRNLIYETYPNEPTCFCLPTDRSTHPMMCRSGCTRSCCMALRNPNILKNHSGNIHSVHIDDLQNNIKLHDTEQDMKYYDDIVRMRGGGDRTDFYLNGEVMGGNYIWRNNNLNFDNRLVGGSEFGNAYSEVTNPFKYEKCRLTEANLRYESRLKNTEEIKDCICSGKDMLSWRRDVCKCKTKPCAGADCLMRAFKEAQEFVDSLGKVPGMVGLGLMDPSESPYFGRDIDKNYSVYELPSEKKPEYSTTQQVMPTIQCVGPCNTQLGKFGVSSAPYSTFIPTTVAMPGRIGVTREAISTLPDIASPGIKLKKKEDKKEEKMEKQKELESVPLVPSDVGMGPCGEAKCKSRRKKLSDHRTIVPVPHESIEVLQKKPATHTKLHNISKVKLNDKQKHKSDPGLAGDRDVGKAPIKISKRVMRFVYSMGDVYPGIHYGHKNCIEPRFRIPANMGWLWNTRATVGKLKPRIGWKPGAIGRYMYELLKEAKMGSLEADSKVWSVPSRTKRRRLYKTASYALMKKAQVKKEGREDVEAPPTIHIHRKNGIYYVTMYPIKQETTDVQQLEQDTQPIQFKIVRNKDDGSIASSSTASDMEIEFSPPAALHKYQKKPNVIHVDTQVKQQEILDAFKPGEGMPKKREKKAVKAKKERK